ncbi:hypothetical protein B4133_2734 [Bacillus altitudinis]|uniref:DUF4241 domain-containing protein n=1 Tax=Bacillus altitudinis TaxID=293387 RepID=UPI0005ADDF61|nr:DUF4241 domain-containing protein [Bacillus altitudinis]KIL26159.1 hypothetical protein B4133_2734 [Bacillus altitudinis]
MKLKKRPFKPFKVKVKCIESIGEIDLPTGKLVACDMFILSEREPSNKTVKPEKYSVLLNIIRFENEDERIAYAIIKLSSKSSVKWELARSDGQIESELQRDQFSDYGVDTGNGCFIDDHTLKSILSEQSQKGNDDIIYEELEEALEKSYEDGRDWR